jgi:hypothetical protein
MVLTLAQVAGESVPEMSGTTWMVLFVLAFGMFLGGLTLVWSNLRYTGLVFAPCGLAALVILMRLALMG